MCESATVTAGEGGRLRIQVHDLDSIIDRLGLAERPGAAWEDADIGPIAKELTRGDGPVNRMKNASINILTALRRSRGKGSPADACLAAQALLERRATRDVLARYLTTDPESAGG